MMRIEFDTIEDYTKYMDLYAVMVDNQPKKEEVTTQEMDDNKRWLHNNYLEKEVTGMWEEIGVNTSNTYELQQRLNSLKAQMDLIEKQLWDKLKPTAVTKNKTDKTKKIKLASGRVYNPTIIKALPNYKELCDDGYFITGNNSKSKYNIQTVLMLKNCLFDLNVTWNDMIEKTGLTANTVMYICYAIETGVFDKFFNEWEQIQADKFQSKVKTATLINNPQKRKENGMW